MALTVQLNTNTAQREAVTAKSTKLLYLFVYEHLVNAQIKNSAIKATFNIKRQDTAMPVATWRCK